MALFDLDQRLAALGVDPGEADHRKRGVGQARQVDQRDLARLGGVAHQARIRVGPALHIAPPLGKAGVDAFGDFSPFVVVDDLGGHDDTLGFIVEGDVGELAGGDAAVHGAHRAERLAAARLERLGRPFLEIGLARGVVADLTRAVGRLGGGDAGDEPPVEIDLHQRQEQVQSGHQGSMFDRARAEAPGGRGRMRTRTIVGQGRKAAAPLPPAPSPLYETMPRAECEVKEKFSFCSRARKSGRFAAPAASGETRRGGREGVADHADEPLVILVIQERLAVLDQLEVAGHEIEHAPPVLMVSAICSTGLMP